MAAVHMHANSNNWIDSSISCHNHPCYGFHIARGARPAVFIRSVDGVHCVHYLNQGQHAVRATAVAVSNADLVSSADPALETLIDRWLSNRQASTSAPHSSSSSSNYRLGSNNSGKGSSGGSNGSSEPSTLWEAVLGPVSVTLDSLSTLEDGDEMFALSDSLYRLAGTLQELQDLALQLQQQPAAAAAAEYSEQLAALLSASAQQADSLQDTALLNLLAIAAVLLTAQTPTIISRSGGSGGSDRSRVQSAAAAAVRVALSELRQRPAAAACLDAAQLTSLSVILHRLSKLGLARQIPSTLLDSAYEQLQRQAVHAKQSEQAVQAKQAVQQLSSLTSSQLAVCFWCLSSSRVAPPASAVVAILDAAAAALSAGQMDGIAVLRMNAALQNLRGYLAAGAASSRTLDVQATSHSAAAAATGQAKGSRLQRAVANFVAAATQHATALMSTAGSSASSTSSSSSSTKGPVRVEKLLLSAAQLCSAYRCSYSPEVLRQQQLLLQAVVDYLPQQQPAAGSSSSISQTEVAAAAGFLLGHWQQVLSQEQQQQVVQAVFSPAQQQQQQEGSGSSPNWDAVLAFLKAAGQFTALPRDCCSVLDITAEQLLQHAEKMQQQQQQFLQCCSLLFRLLAGGRYSCVHLPDLAAAVAAAAATIQPALQAECAGAAADAAVALCLLCGEARQQQLQQSLQQVLGRGALSQVPLRTLVRVALAADSAGPAAADLATAAVEQLSQPHRVSNTTTSQAVEVLALLTHVLQQQQQAGSGALYKLDATAMWHQCMRCMLSLQHNPRGIVPGEIVPLLSALLQLQQLQHQQHQQQLVQVPPPPPAAAASFTQLHKEALAAVALQLEDSARYLSTQQLSSAVRLLALLQYRPTLALAAAVAAAAAKTEQFTVSQLVWLLWGFTKLRFTQERGFTRLLKLAVERAVLPAAAAAAAAAAEVPSSMPQQQQLQLQEQAGLGDTDAVVSSSKDSSSNGRTASASAAAPLHQLVALLWVAASRGYQHPDVTQLLEQIITHNEPPSIAQVSSVAWSFAHMCSYSSQQQQRQQQQRVLGWVDHWCGSSRRSSSSSSSGETISETVLMRSVVNIVWSMNKLGHVPSPAAKAALLAGAMDQRRQLQQQQQQMTPAELSCFVYCLGSWDSTPLTQQQLQQLEQQLWHGVQTDPQQQQQQLISTAGSNSSGNSSSAVCSWDGPALCSCCWGLVNLGHVLQHRTLQAVELRLKQLLPEAPTVTTAPLVDATGHSLAAANGSSSSSSEQAGGKKQRLAVPSAQDLAMFSIACRTANYQPTQLLSQFRGWLLLQLAKQGSAALLKLSSVRSAANRAATAAAARRAGTAAASLTNSIEQQQQQQQQGPQAAAAVPSQHANVLVCVLMMMRQLSYADSALLQQLEAVAASYPTNQQLTGQQLVMVLTSFRQLQYYPATWWASGLRKQIRSRVGQLSARDCIELLDVISAWRLQPGVGSSTSMRQYILPMLTQRLLGQTWAPQKVAAAVAGGSGSSSDSSSSSSSTSPVTPASSSSNDNDSEQQQSKDNSGSSDSSGGDGHPAASEASAAAAATATTAPRTSNMLTQLSGSQVVSLLCSCSRLGIRDKQLQRQALRQLQQQWNTLDTGAQLAAAHAAVRLQYDVTSLLSVQALLPQQQQQQQQQPMQSRDAAATPISSASAAARALWVFGNLGKHPGPALLDAALTTVAAAAAAATADTAADSPQQQQQHLPLREISNALYAAAVLHELSQPAAVALVQQLQSAAAGQLLNHPLFAQHAPQLAACLLASQVPPPTATAARAVSSVVAAPRTSNSAVFNVQPGSSNPSSSTTPGTGTAAQNPTHSGQLNPSERVNPWLGLSRDVQQRLLEAWRRKTLLKSQRKPHRLQQEVVQCLRQLGIRCKANAVTPDACVCVDVAATSPQGEVLAIELLGPHNAASNTQRPMGPARLKWRLLAARGYRVIIINTWQWQSLEGPTRSRDDGSGTRGVKSVRPEVFSEKLLFLQSRLAGPAAAVTAATAAEGAAAGQGGGVGSPAVTQQTVDGIGIGSSSSSMDAGDQGSLRKRLWAEARRPVRPVLQQQQQQ